ncbi:MAG: PEP-CTERM sorting domain-containing protein [Terracidiphilus sp.]|nr:PEP-CTERM sorting domain-containing protein [Terracidiphilus sp.]MDR3797642.1 PEP-CTERM sorting domain-containing protein [Terracidiphilus sp.]
MLVPCVGKADDVLPAATYTAELQYLAPPLVVYQDTGNVYGTDLFFGIAFAPNGSVGILPSPFATSNGSTPLGYGPVPFGGVLSVSDSVTIYAELYGVSSSTLVPVDVDGVVNGFASGSGVARASVSYSQYEGAVTAGLYGCVANPSFNNCGNYDSTAYLLGDTVYEFTVSASGTSGVGGGPGTFQVSNDPTLEIDPTFLADNPDLNIQLEESPGVGNTETPEPGTLALFGSGLLGLVGALRRKIRA